VILGIDPGKVSGWALLEGDAARDAGRCTTAAERAALVEWARSLEEHTRLVVVGERWTGRFTRERSSARTVTGLGASWGRWAEALEAAGHPKRRTLRIAVNDWRRGILGGPSRRTTDCWKAAARSFCMVRWPELGTTWDESPDACESACMAYYASKRPEVLALMPRVRVRP
jgi:hypothetical protein